MRGERPRLRSESAEPAPTRMLERVDRRAETERALLALLPIVRALLFRILGPRADLDDATQDTLIELAAALPGFEGRSSLQTFARTITVRVAYRYFGRREPHQPLDEQQHAHANKPQDQALAERRSLSRLYRCLARLPDKRRIAFVLCAIEGLTPQEAAELTGTSPGSMRARFMHAREELQRMLSAYKEDVHG